jgi:diguanylate cyclase (GGDEF)-like protein
MLGLIPANDPYQHLRLRRFFIALTLYVALIMLSGGYVLAGFMAVEDWLTVSAAILAVNAVIFGVLRSGRNERLPDPSLTLIQMLAASMLTAFVYFYVETARGGLLLVLMALLMFGAFRLRVASFLLVGTFAFACFAAATALMMELRPEMVEWRVALLQLAALLLVIPCAGLFVAYAGELRRELRRRQLELQRANEAVHELSIQDRLTGVHNRSEIVRFLGEECARVERLDMTLTIAMIDLDRFKEINRDHGHATGDEILKRMAAMLEEGLRAVDAIGRYGGEEFLVVLPDTNLEGGRESTERLRQLISGRTVRGVSVDDLQVTLSIGVASHNGADDAESLIRRARRSADIALDQGGDCVVTEAALPVGDAT